MSFSHIYITQLLLVLKFNKIWVTWIIFEGGNCSGKHENRLFIIFIESSCFSIFDLCFTMSVLINMLLHLVLIGHDLEARYAPNPIRGGLTSIINGRIIEVADMKEALPPQLLYKKYTFLLRINNDMDTLDMEGTRVVCI